MISAIVLTKNEEKNIEECLKNLSFCTEIIVIDDESSDNTRKIAAKFSIVYKRKLNGNFAAQLNYGIEKAKGEWLLFIEPDERISEELEEELLKNIKINNSIKAFSLKRIDWFGSRWLKYGEVGSYKALRLVKKGSGKWFRRVHQYFEVNGEVEELENPLKHYPHPTLRKFISNINYWSTLHAIANKEEGKYSNIFKIIFWPKIHFFRNYIFRSGFKDGIEGFLYAVMMALHSFLAWSKLYMLEKRKLKVSDIINGQVKL